MAQVQMTDVQKDQLLNDPNFRLQVKYSIQDQAISTRGNDGTGTSGATALKQWAQWKPLAAQIMNNPNMIDVDRAAQFFINRIAQEQLTCWNDQTNTTTDAIAWLIANNHFGANDLAQAWFAEQVYQGPW